MSGEAQQVFAPMQPHLTTHTSTQQQYHHPQQQQQFEQFQHEFGQAGSLEYGDQGGEQLWFRAMKRKRTVTGPGDFRGPSNNDPFQQQYQQLQQPSDQLQGRTSRRVEETEWEYDNHDSL